MNKLLALSLLLSLSTGLAFANTEGFKDNNIKKVTIAEALKMNDDTCVSIQGNIVKKLSDDKYSFRDSSGTITVEIDSDKWKGVSAGTKDNLELTGEIEKKYNTTYLDVETIHKLTK